MTSLRNSIIERYSDLCLLYYGDLPDSEYLSTLTNDQIEEEVAQIEESLLNAFEDEDEEYPEDGDYWDDVLSVDWA